MIKTMTANQKMAELFQRNKSIISRHIRNVSESGESEAESIVAFFCNNYRKLLVFIEYAPYQIYIMGHSCGTSDRTMLNTLFEHRNCVSIKPFYYEKYDGSDNYLEIVQNISRNCTNMKLMRDRVVNKQYCTSLPQIK